MVINLLSFVHICKIIMYCQTTSKTGESNIDTGNHLSERDHSKCDAVSKAFQSPVRKQ